MNVGIVGSRNFTDERLMRYALDAFEETHGSINTVVSGGAEGADLMGVQITEPAGALVIEHLPDELRYGWPRAAFERNTLIVDGCPVGCKDHPKGTPPIGILLAFFGPGQPPSVNKSGTMDTVRKAIAKRIPVHLYFQREP